MFNKKNKNKVNYYNLTGLTTPEEVSRRLCQTTGNLSSAEKAAVFGNTMVAASSNTSIVNRRKTINGDVFDIIRKKGVF